MSRDRPSSLRIDRRRAGAPVDVNQVMHGDLGRVAARLAVRYDGVDLDPPKVRAPFGLGDLDVVNDAVRRLTGHYELLGNFRGSFRRDARRASGQQRYRQSEAGE